MGRAQRHAGRDVSAGAQTAGHTAHRTIPTVVTFLEMAQPPDAPPRGVPCPAVEIRRACRPTISFYRYLYTTVGEPWTWTVRRLLTDPELATILDDARVEVNVLWVGGVPAGYAELDWRRPPDVELAYFGLVPEFIGRGLGAYLLDWAIRHAWRPRPRRLWVHTCDLDHPRALDLYQRLGFRIYDRRTEEAVLPPGVPEPVGRSSPR